MNIVQLTPGAGGMYCGNCLRDNALVAAYRRRGHAVLMVPIYLPLTLDEADGSAGTPIFFGGLTVYLDHKAAGFRSAPTWLRRWLTSPALLRWTGRFAAKTRPTDVADLTLAMLRGESGDQARGLEEFIAWLRTQPPPDVICLSNALLIGMARQLRKEFGAPVVCLLAGEDDFLDAMPEPQRTEVWRTLVERARDIDRFLAPTRYFADRMRQRLNLDPGQIDVVATGINLEGYPAPQARAEPVASEATDRPSPGATSPAAPGPFTLGYFTRMSRDKGLDTLVEAFLELRRRARVPNVRLKIGGSCSPADEPFVQQLRARLESKGLLGEVEFLPNPDRGAKIAFLRSLTVFSVPARCSEALGLYLIEALAAGVPVVQPDHASFPEVVAGTGGGVLCRPDDPSALAEAIEALLLDPTRRRHLAETGQRMVHEHNAVTRTADEMLRHFDQVAAAGRATAGSSR